MMQILVNVALRPTVDAGDGTSRPMTFDDMLDDEEGFAAAMESFENANASFRRDNETNAITIIGGRGAGEEAARRMRRSQKSDAVGLVAELQLHLPYYVEQRKKTHLWFKLLRATRLSQLQRDCFAYKDRV